jgi:hypothetical protein
MEMPLQDVEISGDKIGYVSGHGTATFRGDIAETQATEKAIGKNTPISSLKSYFGHTLGACGAVESWVAIEMMNDGWFNPTLNLKNIDPKCGDLDYITGQGRHIDCDYIMNNNFAFGGINTSLIFKRVKKSSYGVWGEKKFMGKTYDGIHRISFLINEKGIVEEVFDKFKTKNHHEVILQYLTSVK